MFFVMIIFIIGDRRDTNLDTQPWDNQSRIETNAKFNDRMSSFHGVIVDI